MVAPALLPIGIAAVLGYYLLDEDDEPPPYVPPGEWTDKAKNKVFEVRRVDGHLVVFFRPVMVQAITDGLADSVVIPAQTPEYLAGGGAAVYQVIPASLEGAAGMPNARSVVLAAAKSGRMVLGSYELAAPKMYGRYIAVTTRAMLPKARPGAPQHEAWAVLLSAPWGQPPLGIPSDKPPGLPPGPPGPPQPPPGVEDGHCDANMPKPLCAEVDKLIANKSLSPDALDKAADLFGKSGYPVAAKRLRGEADVRRNQERLKHIQRGGSPFTIRPNDIPHKLAEYYTKDGTRWRELINANKARNMRTVQVNGVTQLRPWHGEILLPLDWEAWTKPLPPVITGGTSNEWSKVKETIDKALEHLGKTKIPRVPGDDSGWKWPWETPPGPGGGGGAPPGPGGGGGAPPGYYPWLADPSSEQHSSTPGHM